MNDGDDVRSFRAVSVRGAGRMAWASSLCVALVACGGEPVKEPTAQKRATLPPSAQLPPSAGSAKLTNLPPLPKREFQERDFGESDANRDPFPQLCR